MFDKNSTFSSAFNVMIYWFAFLTINKFTKCNNNYIFGSEFVYLFYIFVSYNNKFT